MTYRPLLFGLALAGGVATALGANAGDDKDRIRSTDSTTTGSVQATPPDGEQRVPPGYYVPPGVMRFEDDEQTPPGTAGVARGHGGEQQIPPGYHRPPDAEGEGPPDGEQRIPPGYHVPRDVKIPG